MTAFYVRGIAKEYCRTLGSREALVNTRRDAAGHIEASSREMLRLCRNRLNMLLFAHWLAILLISAITAYLTGIVLRPGPTSGVPFAWAVTLDVVVFSLVGLVVRAIASPYDSQAGPASSGLESGVIRISTIPNRLVTAEAPAVGTLAFEDSLAMNVAPTVALACSFALGAMVMFAGGVVIATRWHAIHSPAAVDWSGPAALMLLLISVVPYCCGYRTSRFLPLLAVALAAAATGYLTGVPLTSLPESFALHLEGSTVAIFLANAVLLFVFGWDLVSWQTGCLRGSISKATSEARHFQEHRALVPNTKVPPQVAGIMIVFTMMIAVIYMQTFTLASDSSDQWFHAKVINVVGWNSPLVPFLLVASIILCWCWLQSTQIKRLNDFESNWDPLDVQYKGEQAATRPRGDWIGMKMQKLQEANHRAFRVCSQWYCWPVFREPKSRPSIASGRDAGPEEAASTEPEKLKVNWYLVAASVITIYGLWSLWRQPWLAGPDSHIVWVTVVGIMCCWILIAWEVGRMWHIWTHLETLHRTAARLPMQHVYEHLPEYFARVYGAFFFVERYRNVNSPSLEPHLQWVLQQREQLGLKRPFSLKEMVEDRQQSPSRRRGSGSWVRQYCRAVLPDIERLWAERLPSESYIYSRHESGFVAESPPAKERLDLPPSPLRVTVDSDGGKRPSVLIAPSPRPVDRKQATQQLADADEELLGMALVAYLSQYRIQLKGLAFFLMGAPILLLLAAASYTFMPQGILMDFTALLALTSLVVLAIVYSGLNKDEFLSRVTGTSPRWYSLNPDSVTTFLVIILPLALALAARLPGGEVVYNWFSSVIRSLPSQP